MGKQIYSLDQLQKEKEKLIAERAICKSEFIHSFNTTKSLAKDRLLKIALSAGVVGLITAGIRKLSASDKKEEVADKEEAADQDSDHFNFIHTLLPILLPMVQNYFTNSEESE